MGIICQPLIGPWVDVVGRRPFMLAGAGLNLAASLLATAPGGVPLLALVRVLQGLGFSTFFVASFSYVVDIVPPARRGWALGLYGVSGFVATALAPLIGEWVVRTAGFRPMFAGSTVLAAATCALVWPIREARRGREHADHAGARAGPRRDGGRVADADVRDRVLRPGRRHDLRVHADLRRGARRDHALALLHGVRRPRPSRCG